jgi:hypothetical protein
LMETFVYCVTSSRPRFFSLLPLLFPRPTDIGNLEQPT